MLRTTVAVLLMTASPALAGFEICNNTQEDVTAAIGYSKEDVWTSEGWWTVKPSECATVIEGDLAEQYIYFYGYSESLEWGQQAFVFCTAPDKFTITGDEDCEARGYDEHAFDEIDTGDNDDYTLTLTEDTAADETAPEPLQDEMPGPDALIGNFKAEVDGQSVEVTLPPLEGEAAPFTAWGVLSDCNGEEAALVCAVHADGLRYLISADSQTPAAIVEAMAELPYNSPVGIAGEMLSEEGRLIQARVRNFVEGGDDIYAETREALQGDWQSAADEGHTLSIWGSVATEIRNGELVDSMLEFSEGCEGIDRTGTAMVLVPFDGSDKTCLLIDGLEETILVLDAARLVFRPIE